jgi:hypothetical protein
VIELRDTVAIEAGPREAWGWLEALPDHSLQWHPDHLSAAGVRGCGLAPGAVIEAQGVLHGRRHRLRLACVKVEPERRVLAGRIAAIARHQAEEGRSLRALLQRRDP